MTRISRVMVVVAAGLGAFVASAALWRLAPAPTPATELQTVVQAQRPLHPEPPPQAIPTLPAAPDAADDATPEPLQIADPDAPLDAQLADFLDAALDRHAVDGRLPPVLVAPLAEQFLREESVQVHLRDLTPAERADTLAHIRATFGFPPDAIARAHARDLERDARWEAGRAYMQDRQAAAASLDGAALERAITELRAQYFDRRADTIAREEEAGFFRFQRRRVLGRN